MDHRDLAIELANDAIYLGADDVSIVKSDAWFIVAASTDWILQGSKWSINEVFFHVERFFEYRQNATRATVVIPALAKDVVTFNNGEAHVVQGCEGGIGALAAFVTSRFPQGRVVAFSGAWS